MFIIRVYELAVQQGGTVLPLTDFGVRLPEDDGSPWIIGTTAVGTLEVQAILLREGLTYDVNYRHEDTGDGSGSATFTYTLDTYASGQLHDSASKVVVKAYGLPLEPWVEWCQVDGTTGDITVL